MAFLNSIVSWVTIKRLNQIELFRKYPNEVQIDVFKKLIKRGEDTLWGGKYGYNSITNPEIFKERVPLQNYETLKPYIDMLLQGEKEILWNSDIKWFAKSSGTTNDKSKFIPVSKEALEDCHFRGGKDVIALYTANFKNTNLLKGKGLALGGSHQINKYNNESYFGDLSAILIQNLPFWAQFIRTPDISIALMDEWESKIEKMANATINENVTSLSGVPSWTLVLIKRIFEITGKKDLHEVWPNLELFIHGGVSFVPYREQFKKIIASPEMNYMETYNASEGFFAIQDDPAHDDMLLMLDYDIFYEFLPIENLEETYPKTVSLDEVEIGKNYALIISTSGGLWRYMIGDTIKFTSKYPFKIKITGRTKHFINAFGEEVIVDNAEKALQVACMRTGASILEYTAAPVYMGTNTKGGHQWLIEFSKMPDNLEHFAELLDTTLKTINSDYEAKRYKNMSLTFPDIVVAKPDVFYKWLKERGKLGGQHKVPRLANNREYIDSLLELNKTL